MFQEALNAIGNNSLKSLLEKLENHAFVIESMDESIITDADLADAWDQYYEEPQSAVIYLETCFGFIFERKE